MPEDTMKSEDSAAQQAHDLRMLEVHSTFTEALLQAWFFNGHIMQTAHWQGTQSGP